MRIRRLSHALAVSGLVAAQFQLPGDFADRPAGVNLPHGRDFQVATVNTSVQIHASLHSMHLAP